MTDRKDSGGAAFARSGTAPMGGAGMDMGAIGMSRRDYFAAAALTGFCANPSEEFMKGVRRTAENNGDVGTIQTFVRWAYKMADAMIAESKK